MFKKKVINWLIWYQEYWLDKKIKKKEKIRIRKKLFRKSRKLYRK
jgi:hypothetical protein